jgi:catechol 2,3-dioxygenase
LVPLPSITFPPPFDITRFSHVRLTTRDLAASRRFYEELVGLVVSDEGDGIVYLRGVEEVCHHSLVLRAGDKAECERIGFRVRSEDDLRAAAAFFDGRGLPTQMVELPFQGSTMHTVDPDGLPLELCVSMDTRPRHEFGFDSHRGAAPSNIDHCQSHVVEPDRGAAFYAELGFRISEYITFDGEPDQPLVGAFMARKGNANDLVLIRKLGPRFHHFSYVVHEAPTRLAHLCDVAAGMGLADSIEWGPARHGVGHEIFIYLRDPDGHRIELLSQPFQFIDPEVEPLRWSRQHPRTSMIWGPPPPVSWQNEASLYPATPVTEPKPLEAAGPVG